MTPELQFDEPTHTYTRAGKLLPSVTTVLDDQLREMEGIPAHLVAAAGDFGQHVHQGCNLINRNALAWDLLDDKLVPYLRGYTRFLKESGIVVLASELRVYHPKLSYAGTLDLLALFPGRSLPNILDIKSPEVLPRSVGAQTAAYREAKIAMGTPLDRRRYCLHLKGDGTYELKLLTDPADWNLFLSCLNVYKFRRKL